MSHPMPHFDAEKVFGLFTEAEAKRAKRLIREGNGGSLRSMIVAAMRRAEGMPLSAFVRRKRERIILRTVPAGELQPPAPASSAPDKEREG